MKRGILLLAVLCVAASLAGAQAARTYLLLGDSGDAAVRLLGRPTSYLILDADAGKAIMEFGKSTVEISRNRVVRMRNVPVPAREAYPSLVLGAARDAVLAAWGPPPAALYRGKVSADGPLTGTEEWTYKKSTLFLVNGALAGWDNQDGFQFTTGKAMAGPVPARLGATPDEVLGAATLPTALRPLNDKGQAEWRYGDALLLFRGGKVAGWVDFSRTLPAALSNPGPAIAAPAVSGTQGDLYGNMGTPPVYVPTGDTTLWMYPTNAFRVNAAGTIVEAGTKRYRDKLAAGRPAALVDWTLGLAHLDDVASLAAQAVKPESQREAFETTLDAAKAYADFKLAKRAELLDAYQTNLRYSNEFRAGVIAAWKCESPDDVQALLKQPNDARLGAKLVYDGYKKSLDELFKAYLVRTLRVIPKLAGKTQADAVTELTGMGLKSDVVLFKDGKSRGVTDTVPAAGLSVRAGDTVVLYVAIE